MTKKTIFIVEDDPDILELMKVVVDSLGFKTKTFLENDKLESSIVKNRPDLLIVDLWVGGFDNAVLVKSLKKNKVTKEIPIVLVSAKNALEKIAKQCGADGHLAKPFNVSDLSAIVKKFA